MADNSKTRFFIGLAFAAIGIVLIAGAVMLYRNDKAFYASATEAKAVITELYSTSRAHKRANMLVRYSFQTNGQTIEGSDRWDGTESAFRNLKEGHEITIAYSSGDDGTNFKSRLVTGQERRKSYPIWMSIIGAFFGLLGSGLALRRA